MRKQIVGVLPQGVCRTCNLTPEKHRLVHLATNEKEGTATFKIELKKKEMKNNDRDDKRRDDSGTEDSQSEDWE